MKVKASIMVCFFLLSCFGICAIVYSSRTPDGSRTLHPPAAPVNPNPANNAKGIVGDTVTLMWVPQERYRGDHMEIDQSWVKVSTEGPVYSDEAQANIFNGAVTGTALDIPIEMGKIYYWAVKCHDEDGWGDYSNWKFYTNSYPVAEILTVRPNPAREGVDIEFKGKGEDPVDGDAIVEFEWKSSLDHVISEEKNVIISDLSTGTHEITLRVKDGKGLWSEITEESTKTLKVNANHAPTEPKEVEPVETHSLTPDITWYSSTDEENDEISYHLSIGSTYHGSDIADTTTKQTFYYLQTPLKYSNIYTSGKSENTYYLEIYADDGFNGFSNKIEHRFNIVNHQPLEPVLSLTPGEPTESQDLKLEIVESGVDPDNDKVRHTVEWYLDDAIMKEYANKYTIPEKRLEAGQRWEARVTPNDGIVDGFVGIHSVEIQNTPPNVKISHPKEGLVIDTTTVLLLDASNTSDDDNMDKPKLSYEWSSRTKGWLGNGETLSYYNPDDPLNVGTHEIIVKVSDGFNTVERSVTIVVEETKSPIIEAKILPLARDALYIGEIVEINVELTNVGTGVAKNVDVVLYNNINNDDEVQEFEWRKEWHIPELGVQESTIKTYSWTVEEVANLLVSVNGQDQHARSFPTITSGVGDGKKMDVPSAPPTEKGGKETDWWVWILIIFFSVIIVGGMIIFLVYKVSLKEEDEFEEETGGYGPTLYEGYSDPYAKQLQEQLSYLQNVINTYMPQYGHYGQGQGFPALPPAGGIRPGAPMGQPALPPGPSAPYQTYARQPFYNPFQTQVAQAPLALPPAPSDAVPGGFPDPASAGPHEQPYPYPGYSQYSAPTAPSPGAFSMAQPEYSFGVETQQAEYPVPGRGPGFGGMEDHSGWGGSQPTSSSLSIPTPSSGGYPIPGRGDAWGHPAVPPGQSEMMDRELVAPTLQEIFSDDGGTGELPSLSEIRPKPPKPIVITPKEKVLCHICRAPIHISSTERPLVTVCDSCGATVEVS